MLKVFKYAEEKGIEKGLKKGREEGLEQGLEKGMKEMLSMLLEMKYGEEGFFMMPDILAIKEVSKLNILKDAIKSNMDLEKFKKFLERVKK